MSEPGNVGVERSETKQRKHSETLEDNLLISKI